MTSAKQVVCWCGQVFQVWMKSHVAKARMIPSSHEPLNFPPELKDEEQLVNGVIQAGQPILEIVPTEDERLVEPTPGLTATVEIRTGQKTVLEYLFRPLQNVSQAWRER
jgi:hypothetical protein